MILFIWIGLTQIAPLYLGFDLLSGGGDDIEEDEVEEIVQSMMEASKNADEDDEEDKDNDNDNKKKE
jgi:hypothetical protein